MRSKVSILTENVATPAIEASLIERWADAVATAHGRRLGQLTYIFCDDNRIIEVNRQFLNHDYFTDIITFDYTVGRLIRGDMYISLDTVASNAQLVGADYDTELRRVIIHGVLHLCGINDKGPGEREVMEAHENAALAMLAEIQQDNSENS